jgi:hypothetical protein
VGLGLWIINALLLGEWIPGLLATHLLAALSVGFLLGGLRGRALPGKIRPNEGIRLSVRNALIALLVFGLAGALIGTAIGLLLGDLFAERLPALPGGPAALNPGFVARYALATAASLGIIAGLWLGGAEAIKHLVLRLMAAAGTPLPLDVAGFLDGACDLGLMQRVGGGYRFAHRLLGEHIAARWAG